MNHLSGKLDADTPEVPRTSEGDLGRAAPKVIRSEAELDEWMTRPRPCLVDFIQKVSSPLLLLGAGGKMGPSLAVLARRAADLAGHPLKIIAVSRFSNESSRLWLESQGISTHRADLLEREDVRKLPDAPEVIHLAGQKFGTKDNPSLTWATNTIPPAHVCERYAQSRMVALSTGNVYPLVPVTEGGAREDHPLTPKGEYANAAVARERVFEYFSRKNGTRLTMLRLTYAVELRYGVLVDIARKVRAGESVDVTNGHINCIWQGDANEVILRALGAASTPPTVLNLSGPALSVRAVANKFSELFNQPVAFSGSEAGTALLSNLDRFENTFGEMATKTDDLIRWIADWVKDGGKSLDKPTHFEVRDGNY